MIVDTSAVLAVFLNEPDAGTFANALADAASVAMSVANWLEASMIVDRRGDIAIISEFDRMPRTFGVLLAEVTEEQAEWARIAWRKFGKGSGHPARLNFGDCPAYGLARSRKEPLLFKGNDFSRTNIEPALKV